MFLKVQLLKTKVSYIYTYIYNISVITWKAKDEMDFKILPLIRLNLWYIKINLQFLGISGIYNELN